MVRCIRLKSKKGKPPSSPSPPRSAQREEGKSLTKDTKHGLNLRVHDMSLTAKPSSLEPLHFFLKALEKFHFNNKDSIRKKVCCTRVDEMKS